MAVDILQGIRVKCLDMIRKGKYENRVEMLQGTLDMQTESKHTGPWEGEA
jgi:hypothetical protein